MQNRRPETQLAPSNPSSNFDTTSTTFLHLLSQQQRDTDLNAPGAVTDGPGFHSILAKAVRAYESTAEVLSGEPHRLGASVSIAL